MQMMVAALAAPLVWANIAPRMARDENTINSERACANRQPVDQYDHREALLLEYPSRVRMAKEDPEHIGELIQVPKLETCLGAASLLGQYVNDVDAKTASVKTGLTGSEARERFCFQRRQRPSLKYCCTLHQDTNCVHHV